MKSFNECFVTYSIDESKCIVMPNLYECFKPNKIGYIAYIESFIQNAYAMLDSYEDQTFRNILVAIVLNKFEVVQTVEKS